MLSRYRGGGVAIAGACSRKRKKSNYVRSPKVTEREEFSRSTLSKRENHITVAKKSTKKSVPLLPKKEEKK